MNFIVKIRRCKEEEITKFIISKNFSKRIDPETIESIQAATRLESLGLSFSRDAQRYYFYIEKQHRKGQSNNTIKNAINKELAKL